MRQRIAAAAGIKWPPPPPGLTIPSHPNRYIAPEILAGKAYGDKIDLWSVGVVTYMLLGNCMPFNGETMVSRQTNET